MDGPQHEGALADLGQQLFQDLLALLGLVLEEVVVLLAQAVGLIFLFNELRYLGGKEFATEDPFFFCHAALPF